MRYAARCCHPAVGRLNSGVRPHMKPRSDLDVMRWTNPHGVDLSRPYVYLITIEAPGKAYRYVGKGIGASRMDAYARNVSRVLDGKTKRPALKRNGEPQSTGNLRYRYVHLVLAVAVRSGWQVTHIPLENCSKEQHTAVEKARKLENACDLNGGPSWSIKKFELLARSLVAS